MSLGLDLTTPNLCLQLIVLSHARHVLDEILERVFIHIFGWLAYAKR